MFIFFKCQWRIQAHEVNIMHDDIVYLGMTEYISYTGSSDLLFQIQLDINIDEWNMVLPNDYA